MNFSSNNIEFNIDIKKTLNSTISLWTLLKKIKKMKLQEQINQ